MSTIVTRVGKGSALTWTEGDANITNLNNDKLEHIVSDTTPQLGGSLDVNGNIITSNANGNIVLQPDGGGNVYLNATLLRIGDSNLSVSLTTNGTGNLILNTNNGTNSGNITITQGANANITLIPNGTGQTRINRLSVGTEAIFDFGTNSGSIQINGQNGNVQKITLNGNLSLSLTTISAGYSVTLFIITNGTGRTLTTVGTWKFAGGVNTLSTTNTTDILTVFYDGTTYYASLVKGYV